MKVTHLRKTEGRGLGFTLIELSHCRSNHRDSCGNRRSQFPLGANTLESRASEGRLAHDCHGLGILCSR